ncbi:unnamed protein product [Caretta caretta]
MPACCSTALRQPVEGGFSQPASAGTGEGEREGADSEARGELSACAPPGKQLARDPRREALVVVCVQLRRGEPCFLACCSGSRACLHKVCKMEYVTQVCFKDFLPNVYEAF